MRKILFLMLLATISAGSLFAYSARATWTCTCSSCDECEEDIARGCQLVILDTDIINYSEGTCIDKPTGASSITETTFNCDGHIIDGDGSGQAGVETAINNDFVIQNCTITDFQVGLYMNDDTSNDHSYDYALENNDVSNCSSYGIFLDRAENIAVRNNHVYNNGEGIVIKGTKSAELHDNYIHDNSSRGIVLFGDLTNPLGFQKSRDNRMHDNIIEDNGGGVSFLMIGKSTRNNELSSNEICTNGLDVYHDADTSKEPNHGDLNKGDTVDGPRSWLDSSLLSPPAPPPHFTESCLASLIGIELETSNNSIAIQDASNSTNVSFDLTWTPTNADTCSASTTIDGISSSEWEWDDEDATGGGRTDPIIPDSIGARVYTIDCENVAGDSATAFVNVDVNCAVKRINTSACSKTCGGGTSTYSMQSADCSIVEGFEEACNTESCGSGWGER